MVRGLVSKESLLEWTVEGGWEPLCAFLGKPVPDEPFPYVNAAAAAGWAGQETKLGKRYILGALKKECCHFWCRHSWKLGSLRVSRASSLDSKLPL